MQTWTTNPSHRFDLSALPPGRRRAVIAALAAAGLLVLSGLVTAGLLWHLVRQFPRAPYRQSSRLYARSTPLAPGAPLTADDLVDQLSGEGYRAAPAGDLTLRRGTYRRAAGRRGEDVVAVHLRRFPTPEGTAGGAQVEVAIAGGRVTRLTVAGQPADSAPMEPPLLASFYGSEVDERLPVSLDALPEIVVRAVLAAEDDSFYLHPGISPTGIVRALWVNLRGGTLQQGGSTVTQQLVKNLYLTRRRTLGRKLKEAVVAVLLEARYGKRQILETYLNEIYWGRSGPANLVGLGAAAHAYFGKDAGELSLAEAATLAGMIRGPAEYSPLEHPDKACERRDWVLKRMAELGWITRDQAERARSEPLRPEPQTVSARPLAPYFAKVAAEEARARFGIDDLADGGYVLFSTLDGRDQRQAEAAVEQGLTGLEKGAERHHPGEAPLQAALISVDPRDGAIRAWVGGRDYNASQFDRVAQARRQAGSAFKPVIYAAAFRDAVVSPATLLNDSPIVVRVGNESWQPQDNDRGFRGWVTVRAALEQSLNIPTIRLALQVGLPRIVDLAHDMGITGDPEPVPALALGALEVSPYEMAQAYSTLAAGGLRPPLYGLTAARDRSGQLILGKDVAQARRVMPVQTAYEVTSLLQGVVDRGTGAGVRSQGLRDPLAGKTGTTNDRRDNWFAGYAPDRATVVWVGYDDNGRTRLSGARAALPIWSRFMLAVRPAGGYAAFTQPLGMQTVTIDPLSGQLATPDCPYQVTETLPDWQVPAEPCQMHQPGMAETRADLSLNGAPIDPVTGQPASAPEWDPYGQEDARPAAASPLARAAGPRPLTAAPAESTAAANGGTGSIVIRPSRQRQPPPPPPPISSLGVNPPDPPPPADSDATPPPG